MAISHGRKIIWQWKIIQNNDNKPIPEFQSNRVEQDSGIDLFRLCDITITGFLKKVIQNWIGLELCNPTKKKKCLPRQKQIPIFI